MKIKHTLVALAAPMLMNAQQMMTPEILWTLKKISVQAVSPNQSSLIYKVGQVDLKTEKTNNKNFSLNILNGQSAAFNLGKKSILQWDKNGLYALEGDKIFISKDDGKTWTEFYTIGEVDNVVISPDGKKIAFSKQVLVEKVMGKEAVALEGRKVREREREEEVERGRGKEREKERGRGNEEKYGRNGVIEKRLVPQKLAARSRV